MFVMVVAAEAGAFGGTHFSDGEALAVHLDAVGFLAGASRLLFLDIGNL